LSAETVEDASLKPGISTFTDESTIRNQSLSSSNSKGCNHGTCQGMRAIPPERIP
jgi:hypothetical protein